MAEGLRPEGRQGAGLPRAVDPKPQLADWAWSCGAPQGRWVGSPVRRGTRQGTRLLRGARGLPAALKGTKELGAGDSASRGGPGSGCSADPKGGAEGVL